MAACGLRTRAWRLRESGSVRLRARCRALAVPRPLPLATTPLTIPCRLTEVARRPTESWFQRHDDHRLTLIGPSSDGTPMLTANPGLLPAVTPQKSWCDMGSYNPVSLSFLYDPSSDKRCVDTVGFIRLRVRCKSRASSLPCMSASRISAGPARIQRCRKPRNVHRQSYSY